MAKNNIIAEIKALGWNVIKLNQKTYRGGIMGYKNDKRDIVPIMFYIDECFIIEDAQGLYRVEDLKDFFITHTNIDLSNTEYINNLKVIAFIDDRGINFNDEDLVRLGISNDYVKSDIERRLKSVYRLGEVVDVDMGFDK